MTDPDASRSEHLIEMGADLAGALAGGALSLVGGPAGALGGAALSVAVKKASGAIAGLLSKREEERMGAVLALVVEESRTREECGDRVRDDEFFDEHNGRSDADEVLEGVLRQAAATFEERKLPFLGHLYTSVAHDVGIDRGTAIFLLRQAERLSYRQLLIMSLAASRDLGRRTGDDRFFLPSIDAALSGESTGFTSVFAAEVKALADAGLLAEETKPNSFALTAVGQLLVETMRLETIDDQEILQFIADGGGRALR